MSHHLSKMTDDELVEAILTAKQKGHGGEYDEAWKVLYSRKENIVISTIRRLKWKGINRETPRETDEDIEYQEGRKKPVKLKPRDTAAVDATTVSKKRGEHWIDWSKIDDNDVAQKAYIKLINSLRLYRGENKLDNFIRSVIKSCLIDLARKNVSMRMAEEKYLTVNEGLFKSQYALNEPEKAFIRMEEATKLKVALRMHSESGNTTVQRKSNQRSCRELELYSEDYKNNEIAEKVGRSSRQVIRDMQHDLEALRKILKR
jgi:DNA-directed RNA polymerase specialized sigma24 family protein